MLFAINYNHYFKVQNLFKLNIITYKINAEFYIINKKFKGKEYKISFTTDIYIIKLKKSLFLAYLIIIKIYY